MTIEELRKKIVDVLRGNIEYELHYFPDDNYTELEVDYDKLADALITAGLCDKNTLDERYQTLMAAGFVQLASLRLDLEKVLHRAEVAERAARDLIAYYCNYTIQSDIDSSLSVALQQAERELAEEKKDD